MEENLENNEQEELIETEEKITPEIDSKYRLILLAAQRSKQLQRGATPRVEVNVANKKPTRIALNELQKGKVHFEILSDEEEENNNKEEN